MDNSPSYSLPAGIAVPTDTPARFRVDLDVLAAQLRPALLRRGPRLRAWCRSLLFPFRQVYAGLLLYRLSSRRELSYSGQRLLFEAALNFRFDPGPARIRIVTSGLFLQQTYDYFTNEGQPLVALKFDDEAGYAPDPDYLAIEFNTQVDFTVQVPQGLLPADPAAAIRYQAAINTAIRRYKPATIRHDLLFI